jgi:hypothetical protein
MKNKFVTLILASALLASCAPSTKTSAVGNLVQESQFANLSANPTSLNKMLAVDVASALPLMGTSSKLLALNSSSIDVASSGNETSASSTSVNSGTTETPKTDESDPIPGLLNSVDLFMAEDAKFDVKEVTSTREGYQYQLDVSYSLFGGETSTYSLNYNSSKEEKEISEDETETTITIEGVSLIDQLDYTFSFVNESEVSKDEQESKVTFTLRKDLANYVEVVNSLELEENEKELKYSYKSVVDGAIEQAYKLSYENEDEDEEEETQIETSDKTYTFETYEKEGKTLVEVEIEDHASGTEVKKLYERLTDTSTGSEIVTYLAIEA